MKIITPANRIIITLRKAFVKELGDLVVCLSDEDLSFTYSYSREAKLAQPINTQ
jgi:hypothetical protein